MTLIRSAGRGGAIGGAVALLVLLGARIAGAPPGVLEVVADAVVVHLPASIFAAGIQTFGPYGKSILFGLVAVGFLVTAIGMAVTAAIVRAVPRRGPLWDGLMIGAFAFLVGQVLVLPLAGAGIGGSRIASEAIWVQGPLGVASLLYGVVAALSIHESRRAAAARAANPGPGPTSADRSDGVRDEGGARELHEIPDNTVQISDVPVRRRTLLEAGLLTVGLAAMGGSVAILIGRAHKSAAKALPGIPGDPEGSDGFGFTRAVTPVPEFYFVSKDYVPLVVDAESWHLRVSGLVDQSVDLTLDDLRTMPGQEAYRTLQCISASSTRREVLIGNQRWRGVRVRDVLERVGVHPAAAFVVWGCADGYFESLPLDVAVDDNTWLAYEMGPPGTPLPAEHGFPLRVLVAGRYGMKQPKHVVTMTLADRDDPGWWVRGGWQTEAPVRTYCRIDLPAADGVSDAVLVARPFTAYGIACSGDRGISRVEISLSGGITWQDAQLEPLGGPIGPLTWVRWRAPVVFEASGSTVFMARATDGRGTLQDEAIEDSYPRGAAGYPRVPMMVYASVP